MCPSLLLHHFHSHADMSLSLLFLFVGWRILFAHSYVFSIDKVQLRASPSVTLRNGDNLSLTCFVQFIKGETESFELTTQFAFFKNFKQIYNVSSNSPNATYRLSPARVSSSGQYQCKVHVGQMMKQSGIVTITVTGLSKPKLSVSTNSTKEGQTIIVKCEAPEEEPPFRFTFYKMKNNGNKDMEVLGPIPTSENPASMEVSMAEGDRIVRFLCDVALTSLPNSNVSDLSDWMLVTVEQQFSTPRIEVSPSLNFTEGKEMSVKCSIQTSSSVSGKVQLFIQNGTHILTSSKTDTVWYAQRATESHSGQYICKAEYEQTSKSNSTNVTVTELFKSPSLYSNIRNSTMDEDARLSLSCSVQGISPSSAHNFSLLKDGQIRSNSEKLEIYAKTSDSGTYRCMVTISNITKTSGDLPIRVYAPVSKPLLSHRNQSTSMAVQGSTIELRCKCDKGTPPITYSLMKGSTVLSNITETEAKAAMFKLNISEQQNSGQYRCRAYNLHSSSLGFSNTVNITVISPITEVTLTTIPQSGTVEEGKELSLVCAVKNGSLPIDFHFLVKRGKESVLHSSMDKSVFHSETQIKSFSANDDGSYFCRATNGAHQTVDSNLVHVKAVLATWKKGLIITFVVFILIAAVAICSYFYTERKKKGRETALDMNRTTNEKSSSKEKSAAIGLRSEEESCLVPGNVVQSEDENHVDKSPEGNLGNNKEKPEVEPVTPNPHQDGSEATPREQKTRVKMSKCPSEDV
uniref:Platelet and endothelial cell adhesion molecule 1 n=1 Tax=Xenopus tropicalis TaxID=8364 RepID=A0A803JFB0_XENTR